MQQRIDISEGVHDMVGSGIDEALARTVAVGDADGGASGVAPHEYVEVRVAYHDGIGGCEAEVLEGLCHGFGVGFGVAHILGGDDERDDVVEGERVHELRHRLVAAACGYGEGAALVVEASQRVGDAGEHGHAYLAVHIVEDAAVGVGAACGALGVHAVKQREGFDEWQTYRRGYFLVAVLGQPHGVERAVEGVEDYGFRVGNGAVEVEDYYFLHIVKEEFF